MKARIVIAVLVMTAIYIRWNMGGTSKRLRESVEALRIINSNLNEMIDQCREKKTVVTPSLPYEKSRRRVFTTMKYLWENVKYHIGNLIQKYPNHTATFNDLRHAIYEHRISLLSDWKVMSTNDGYEEWRHAEAQQLSDLVQKRFHYTQNPSDCGTAKYLKCTGEWSCGWACQLERYAECMAIAFGLQRVLYFYKGANFNYEPDEFQRYYEPISGQCTELKPGMKTNFWPGTNDVQIIQTPEYLRDIKPHMKFLFVAIPEDLSERLIKVFLEPTAWWLGQVEKYLFQLNKDTQNKLDQLAKEIGFKKPIVGLHVRRTDKIKEASYQPLELYMEHVDAYYDQLELTEKVDKRRVFMSTDEPNVIKEFREKYKNYELLVDENATQFTHSLNVRFKNSLGILLNSRLLAQCDYFVGTFSSNIGRRVYEFMYWDKVDAGERYVSLDTRHFEVCENYQLVRAITDHVARDSTELSVHVGQELELLYQYNPIDTNGLTKVRHRIDRTEGYVPSFKVEKILETTDFPTLPNIK